MRYAGLFLLGEYQYICFFFRLNEVHILSLGFGLTNLALYIKVEVIQTVLFVIIYLLVW